jgi:hypothetical protein
LMRAQFWAFVAIHHYRLDRRRHEVMLYVSLLPLYIEKTHHPHK